jgi:hypothetical protein
VATPNYSYEKRQRELAKKRKKEEKAARKSQGGPSGGAQDTEASQPANTAPGSGNEPSNAA